MHIRADSILAEETPRRALERDGRSLSPASAHARPSRGYDRHVFDVYAAAAFRTPSGSARGQGVHAERDQLVEAQACVAQRPRMTGPTGRHLHGWEIFD